MQCLCALADCCNFPTDDEKNVMCSITLVCTLSDKDLVKNLLALDLKADVRSLPLTLPSVTTWMQWALLYKPVHAIHQGKQNRECQHGASNLGTNTNVGIIQNHIHLDEHLAQPRTHPAINAERLVTGNSHVIEEHPRDHSNPTKEGRKEKEEDDPRK